MPKLRNLKHQLEEFNRWLEHHSKKKTAQQKVKSQAAKIHGKSDELIEDITQLATNATRLFQNVVDEVIHQKTPAEKLVRDMKRKGEDIAHHVGSALKDTKGVAGGLKNALTMLKEILTKGLSTLISTFKDIFNMPDPHQKHPKFSPSLPKHKGPPQHLRSEQRFKAGQHGPTHVEAHRKILTKPN